MRATELPDSGSAAVAEWRKVWKALYSDARVRHLSVTARYIHTASIVFADDDGKLPWNVAQLSEWAAMSPIATTAAMATIEAQGLVTVVNGVARHPAWRQYQRDRPEHSDAARTSRARASAGVSAERQTDRQSPPSISPPIGEKALQRGLATTRRANERGLDAHQRRQKT
jgi:hypothetical protein